ncbi:ribonuclease catalytic domain-containing protein [Vacuolonema iberomarrocanum]|uniref:ribonuclease catalytic domain-containing protein n=1 Tax=Vacuolonema iberomarrocanum TaxID=3454632 RepID=UPI0019E0A038|nr:VacB/RNase II family 3'-5' exoribonuclease [filamentous cyanobacterium LEGE 07170]
MEKGTLVEFRMNGDRHLAVADRPEGKRDWIVIDQRGQSHKLHPRDITYTVGGRHYTSDQIPQFLDDISPYLDPTSLEVAWELLVEEGEATDAPGMALLLFSEQSEPLCYAAHCLLSEDKLFFKQKGDRYEPRPATQVSEIRHQQAMQAQRQQEWEQFLAQMRAALAGETVDWESGDRTRIEALEKFAALGDTASTRNNAADVLGALDRPNTADGAFQLLVDLKLWSPHENLFVRRSQLPVQFSRPVLEAVQQYQTMPPPDSSPDRLDLTHLKVYTIDDASTREIDDGLSLEFQEDGIQRIWIHIADPTRWVTPGDVLEQEARRRCTTVYLPTGMIPMFPQELATGPMSLIQGRVCYALSFGIILDGDGAICDYEIHPTLIKPTYRLTYEDVDEMLQLGVTAEEELLVLEQWAQRRLQFRRLQGAIDIRMPESSIKVLEDEVVIEVLEDAPSRQLVAEMMILAGETAGRYGQEQGIPLPFRGQPQPELPPEEELLALPSGPVRYSAIRRCMPRSETSIAPIRHASLGLDTYTQVTSPIRRYADLLAHFQLKAHLRGDELPFSEENLKETLQSVGSTTYEAVMVERQSNRYWGLEFLRRHSGEIWSALMLRWLREHENLGLVLLEDLGLELAMRFERDVHPGDRLDIQATYVDPQQDIIRFTEVRSPLPQEALN